MKRYKYIFFLLVTGAIFLSGAWMGEQIASFYVDDIIEIQEDLQLSATAIGLQSEILGGDICDVDIFKITAEKFELGQRLSNLEAQRGYDDPDVVRLKNRYSIYSIQQYLLVKRQREECNAEVVPILFFYDNENAKDDSEIQGYVLEYVWKNYPERVATYALSINVHNAAVDALMEQNDVISGPTLVVDGERYEGIFEADEVFDILGLAA